MVYCWYCYRRGMPLFDHDGDTCERRLQALAKSQAENNRRTAEIYEREQQQQPIEEKLPPRTMSEPEYNLMTAERELALAKASFENLEKSGSLDTPTAWGAIPRNLLTEEIKIAEAKVKNFKAALKTWRDGEEEGRRLLDIIDNPPFERTTQPKWMHDLGMDERYHDGKITEL